MKVTIEFDDSDPDTAEMYKAMPDIFAMRVVAVVTGSVLTKKNEGPKIKGWSYETGAA